jgi:anthranilate phosphoribosyltransferase
MREYFTRCDTGALALRGAEGEAVAHPRRASSIEWLHEGKAETWWDEDRVSAEDSEANSEHERREVQLPESRDADVTARWIEAALKGDVPVPGPIRHQVACCVRAIEALKHGRNAAS